MTLLDTQLAVFVTSENCWHSSQQMERQQTHRASTLNSDYLVIQQKNNKTKQKTTQPNNQ